MGRGRQKDCKDGKQVHAAGCKNLRSQIKGAGLTVDLEPRCDLWRRQSGARAQQRLVVQVHRAGLGTRGVGLRYHF